MSLGRNYLVFFLVLITYTKESFSFASYSDYYFRRIQNDEENALCLGSTGSLPSDISNLNNVLEYQSCFANKKKSFASFIEKQPTSQENLELIYGDIGICNCLRDKAVKNPSLGVELARGARPSDETKLDSLPKNYENNLNNAIQENGKFLFDASMICQGDEKCLGLWVSKNTLHNAVKEKSNIDSLLGTTGLEKIDPNQEKAREMYEKYYDKASKDKIKEEGNAYAQSLLEETPPVEGQCVLGREFIAFKQKESFEEVSQSLSQLDLNNFNPDEWDFRKLKRKYDSLMTNSPEFKKANEEEINSLKNKLIFLNYNPLVKTFLTIDPRSDEEIKKIPPGFASRTGIKPEFFLAENVKNRKTELLRILKSYAGPQKSVCTANDQKSCMDNVLKNKNLKEFNTSLKDFFLRADNGKVAKIQSHQLAKDLLFQHRPVNDNNLPLTQEAIVSAYLKENPGKDPDRCASFGVDNDCPEIYGGYCKKLDLVRPKIFLGIKEPIADDLDLKLENSFNPNIKTNPEFLSFNKRMCDSKFQTKNKESVSFNEYKVKDCKQQNLIECRTQFFQKKVKGKLPDDVDHMMTFLKRANVKFYSRVKETILNIRSSSSGGGDNNSDWESVRSSQHLSEISENDYFGFDNSIDEKLKPLNDEPLPSEITKDAGKMDPTKDDSAQAPFSFNPDYSASSSVAPSLDDKKSDKQKIENMTDEKKKNLLSDWENEYEDWRKSKNATDTSQLSPADSAKDSLYKKEIETLRTLLEEQRKLTETQSKLLNDAISRKNADSVSPDQKPVVAREKMSQNSNVFGQNSSSSFSNSSSQDADSASRNPASFSEAAKLNNSSSGANAFKNVSNSGGSSRRSSVENSDSLAREQAKLVNVKSFSDGSILVEPNSGTAPNAITLSVSDEQYKVLLVNPTGLSLNQIEKSIPVDQITKLEKSGEIILLLKNGSNPPFEVKVERKQNKLVYSLKDKNGKDQKPVRRVFTRKALENELKVQR